MNATETESRTPKYRQLAEQYRERIHSGALKAGDRLPTLNEMKDELGISRPTVEKAYRLLEQDGLIQSLHGSGVFVTELRAEVSSARRAGTGILGVCGQGFGVSGYSTYWANLLGGAREAARAAKVQLLLLDAAEAAGWEKVDGALVCDWNDSRAPRPSLPGLPLVSLLTPVPGMASVVADDYGSMRVATEHLLALGHRRIGYLHAHADQGVSGLRLRGYRDALRDAGIEAPAVWMRLLGGNYYYGTDFTREGHRDVSRWLREDWSDLGCTALLCHNDETAVGAVQAFQEFGLRVPEHASVIGFDGTAFCNVVSPRLTSIGVPLAEIGATAVRLLLRQIQSGEADITHHTLPATLQVRESTTQVRP